MFASIPNFQDFYSEDIENGKACIRILNEIICDFDSLMDEPRFATVEKIKTVGATYMGSFLCEISYNSRFNFSFQFNIFNYFIFITNLAASGLNPKHQVRNQHLNLCMILAFEITVIILA